MEFGFNQWLLFVDRYLSLAWCSVAVVMVTPASLLLNHACFDFIQSSLQTRDCRTMTSPDNYHYIHVLIYFFLVLPHSRTSVVAYYYFASLPREGAKYCNKRVCVCVCGSVCLSLASQKPHVQISRNFLYMLAYMWLWLGLLMTTMLCYVM